MNSTPQSTAQAPAKADGKKVVLPVWSSARRLEELRRYQFAMQTRTAVPRGDAAV